MSDDRRISPYERNLIDRYGIIWRQTPDWLPHGIGALDCLNVASDWNATQDDEECWRGQFRPGGFRETILLLMLHG